MSTYSNDLTESSIFYYQQNAVGYIEETIKIDMHTILEQFLQLVQNGGHILDLGCGSGRDSRFFIDRGYCVTSTDAASGIAELTSKFLGQKVIVQFAQRISETEVYDAIWACASLLHVPKSEMFDTFTRITTSLKPDGIWYMSFKCGTGEYWDERGRFFNCYTMQSITQLIERLPKLKIISFSEDIKQLRGKPQCWLNIFVRKQKAQ